MLRTLDTPSAQVSADGTGLVVVRIRQGAVVELEDMERILEAQEQLMGDRAVVLVDSRGVRSMSRAAQQRSADNHVSGRTLAVAILVDSPVSFVLGNFFLKLAGPTYPTRLFRDEPGALAWLLDHLVPG